MGERPGPPATDRRSFYDELHRRRRRGWLLSLLCLLIAGGIGVVLSSVVTPLLLLAAGGLLRGVAAVGLFPDMARAEAHVLGAWAALQSKHFDAFVNSLDHVNGFGDLGVTVAPLLKLAPVALPALLAACVVWLALRRIAWRDEGRDMIARLHARSPDGSDLRRERGQFAGGLGTCHKALTGRARSLSPNGSVEVPV